MPVQYRFCSDDGFEDVIAPASFNPEQEISEEVSTMALIYSTFSGTFTVSVEPFDQL